ncbi:MAG: malto-oligosyltrehalose trehalohydrolase [Steroidobacteraceae bacterium]
MPFGCALKPEGGARFRLWAPSCAAVMLELTLPRAGAAALHAMRNLQGWHEIDVPDACDGASYRYIVNNRDGQAFAVPDPASRCNPEGVHAASIIVDPTSYAWQVPEWRGRSWPDAVLYELHIGTFTHEGTFAAARERLVDLKLLGVTALQIMPLAAFPGARNWGYDGVLQFAPAPCYGSPSDLKAFIDGAHTLGMMVLLDVVYNHFGPEGNYLHAYCPEFFNPAHRTPWGAAINFEGQGSRTVRDFFVHNALYWIEEFRFDGLRLDAIHAMRDRSSPDIVAQIAAAIHAGPGLLRQVHLVLENNANQARYLEGDAEGEPRIATSQWNDDVHHALHVLVSGEADGYYADYAAQPLEMLGRSLAEGFAYQGEHSRFRDRPRGELSAQLPPAAFVGFLQNHDMVGNRAFGDRIQAFADSRLILAAYACLLLSPQVPMLFMGEEWAASTPFLFFCDFGPELAHSVSNGRRQEFKRFAAFADDAAVARIPDPNAESSFTASKLRWQERHVSPHRERLDFIRELLALRRHYLAPHLSRRARGGSFEIVNDVLRVEWRLADDRSWCLMAHFGEQAVYAALPETGTRVFSLGGVAVAAPQARLEPGAVIATYT